MISDHAKNISKNLKNFKKLLAFSKKLLYNIACVKETQKQNKENARLAQLVEHLTLNQGVQGSNPWRCICESLLI